MLSPAITVARKELIDHLRDTRALVATVLLTLMGPIIVGLIVTVKSTSGGRMALVIALMASVFTVVATFTGGMGVAADSIAGERERKSLLPLLSNATAPLGIIIGKWLAASVFATACLLITFVSFVLIIGFSSGQLPVHAASFLQALASLAALCALCTALQIMISAQARNVKEAQTYLSFVMFGIMAFAMWMAFRSEIAQDWWHLLPLGGQLRLLQLTLTGGTITAVQTVVLVIFTSLATTAVLIYSAALFRRDEVVYGK